MNVLRGKESRRRMVSELDHSTTHLVTAPPIPRSISTDSLAEETMCWDSSCHAFSAPAFRFPLSPLCLSTTISPVNLPEAGFEPPCDVLQAKSSVHGVEHRRQSAMDGNALRLKLHRALSISR
jgi:hypothetical protein